MKARWATAFTCMAWLGLTGAGVVVTRAHAEDPLGGHRLFFTDVQRRDASLQAAGASAESLPEASASQAANTGTDSNSQSDANTEKRDNAVSAYPAATRQRRLVTDRDQSLTKTYYVYFTGLVTGIREARALVNGLPCEPVSSGNGEMSVQPVPVDCHGVRKEGLKLAVSIVSGELWVTDHKGQVHQLLPGEGI